MYRKFCMCRFVPIHRCVFKIVLRVYISVTVVDLEHERASRGAKEVKNITNCQRATLGNWIRSPSRCNASAAKITSRELIR